ncbi:Golgi transport complex subunit COG5 PWA37_000793 [Arxiozyma heterogenica]|uniref:Conserved oligomeric Golgi complex subunit 5 n=1 Tax=Arxiozyma heterogenica TaxID=278026 RepID=A0AAN7WKS5_9SACH|nr:hypothetical protein RI543_002318 [Kazachstania heterogenica]
MNELKDFDNVLQDPFSPVKFANDLLLMTNKGSSNDTSEELQNSNNVIDLDTSIKKINFDLNEIDKLYERVLSKNSNILINHIYESKQNSENISNGLLASLNFVELSYERLNNEVYKPYELSQKLQSTLNKVHQTSTLLRDSLLYLYIFNMIKTLTPQLTTNSKSAGSSIVTNNKQKENEKEENNSNNKNRTFLLLKLSSLYYQLQLTLGKNINLISLTTIKNLQNDWIKNNQRQLIRNLSNTLYQHCNYLNHPIQKGQQLDEINQLICKLAQSLYLLSPKDFNFSINKFMESLITTNSQILIKTINNVKEFPSALSRVTTNVESLNVLQDLLSMVTIDSLTQKTLLSIIFINNNFSSPSHSSNHSLEEIHWMKVSQLFKKELEISFNRGGPVGKNLLKNKSILKDTMHEYLELRNNTSLSTMLKSLSILS